ncbi:hypothetical protein GCM10008101_00900 [Lysobacter xinjiangensis]|uniref:Cell division and transport-associated protein TolA n=1 Tax=Cognatilysobacter xinjiangensis TaxID=546892 RepID=A0ABQ3BR52_9GAMM|nr:cell envelope integrity protein TolA [Lysobacter xinjiangensis]GGZ51708.1 hypothetical protein GCM10008101_00900 [Lysobacter xinjiangensis]
MRTRPTDDASAIALAVALHLGLAALLWLAMRPSDAVQASAGGIAADVVAVGDLSAAMQRTLRDRPEPVEEPVEEPLPEPLPDEPEPQPEVVPPPAQPEPQVQLPQPEAVEQEEVVDTPTPVKATETKVQEAKNRQRQAELDRIAQAKAQADAKAKADAAREVEQRRIAAEREKQLNEIRQRRAAASRAAIAAEQRLAQLTAPRSGGSPTPGPGAASAGAGDDDGLRARYAAALQEAIRSKWTRPDNVQSGSLCRLVIRQLPGGEVMDVQVSSPCSYDDLGQRSIEAAVRKAQPLPYTGFEKVFERTLILNFRAP